MKDSPPQPGQAPRSAAFLTPASGSSNCLFTYWFGSLLLPRRFFPLFDAAANIAITCHRQDMILTMARMASHKRHRAVPQWRRADLPA